MLSFLYKKDGLCVQKSIELFLNSLSRKIT